MDMEFDKTKENDKEYLKEYYQSKIDYWKDKPNSEFIVKKYKKALKKLKIFPTLWKYSWMKDIVISSMD